MNTVTGFTGSLRLFDPASSAPQGGTVLYNHDGRTYVAPTDEHTMIVSGTGAGKTVGVILPSVYSMLLAGQSVFVTDPKGEIYCRMGAVCKAQNIPIIRLDLRKPRDSDHFCLFENIYRKYHSSDQGQAEALTEISSMAEALIQDGGSPDPQWKEFSRSLFVGLMLLLMKCPADNLAALNFKSVNVLKERLADQDGLFDYVKDLPRDSSIRSCLSSVITNANETRRCIFGCYSGDMRAFTFNDDLIRMLAEPGPVDVFDLGNRQMMVCLIMPDDSSTYFPIATLIVNQLYKHLVDVAGGEPDHALPVHVNMVLEELGVLPPIPDLDNYLSAGRSRNLSFLLCAQSFSQLQEKYGSRFEGLKSNVSNLVYMYGQDLSTLRYVSDLLGVSPATGRPLMSTTELQTIPFGKALVIGRRKKPFITTLDMDAYLRWPIGDCFPKNRPESTQPIKIFDGELFLKEGEDLDENEDTDGLTAALADLKKLREAADSLNDGSATDLDNPGPLYKVCGIKAAELVQHPEYLDSVLDAALDRSKICNGSDLPDLEYDLLECLILNVSRKKRKLLRFLEKHGDGFRAYHELLQAAVPGTKQKIEILSDDNIKEIYEIIISGGDPSDD